MDAILDPKLVEPTILHSVDPRQTSISHEIVVIQNLASTSPEMSCKKVPITFTYKEKGTNPPVYVAGSFSNPPWEPQEMEVAIDQLGGHLFTKQVMVDDGTEIQYKFRIGPGDWWVLDETADIVTDESGNRNNVLRVSINTSRESAPEAPTSNVSELEGSQTNGGTKTPDIAETAAEVADSARTLDPETPEPEISDDEAGRIGTRRMSATPITEVSETAIEVASIAATLDPDESALDDDEDDGETNLCPMFSHESVRPASHKGDISDDDDVDEDSRENKSHSEFGNPAIEIENLDFDDPQLEAFPSDNRESILAAMRRISTSIDADRTVVDGIPAAPIITILQNSKLADSLDNQSEPLGLSDSPSDDKQNLHPSNGVRRSHSMPRESSTVSLGSIMEDDEARNENAIDETEDATAPFIQHPGPSWRSPTPDRTASDDDNDEGIAMRVESKKRAEGSQECSPALISPPATVNGDSLEATEPEPEAASEPKESAVEDDKNVPESNDDALAVAENELNRLSPSITTTQIPERGLSVSPTTETTSVAEGKSTSFGTPVTSGTTSPPGLRKRIIERPVTPPSMHNFERGSKYPAWLEACLQIVFVKWIGGLATWLQGRRNRVLMTAGTAAIVIGVGLLWQSPVRL